MTDTEEFIAAIIRVKQRLEEQIQTEGKKTYYLPGPLAYIIKESLEKQGYKVIDEGGGYYSY